MFKQGLAHSRQTTMPLIVCIVMLIAAGLLESVSQPVGVRQGYLVTSANRDEAVVQATGEFRIVAANILWEKVIDHYHHQYIADGGDWSKNVSLLPLLQTIITLDPHFTQAYEVMGGAILPNTGRMAEGQAVLAKGIQNNPNDWDLDREMALLLAWRQHKNAPALVYAQMGLKNADDDFSRQLMAKFVHTLQDRVHEDSQKGTHAGSSKLSPPAEASSLARMPKANA